MHQHATPQSFFKMQVIMGVYHSTTKTAKASEDGEDDMLKFGASAMQGWRSSMEDSLFSISMIQRLSLVFMMAMRGEFAGKAFMVRGVTRYSRSYPPQFTFLEDGACSCCARRGSYKVMISNLPDKGDKIRKQIAELHSELENISLEAKSKNGVINLDDISG